MGKIKRITIILGKSCNLKCKYCIQHSTKNTIKDSPNINPDIYSFIEKFSKKNSLTIRFVGGEPLLYFNKMKDIDNYFDKIVHPNIRRCLNGTTKKAYGYTWKEIE